MTLDEIKRQLAFTLQYMVATERLLGEASMECGGELRQYYLRHLEEERHHAQWLQEDLDGFTIPLDGAAVGMAGSAYYFIKHVNPAALLGYMLALERPMPLDKLAELEAAHGVKLFRTVRLHAEEDVQHRADLLELIEKQPPDVQTLIKAVEAQTLHYLQSFKG
jgi:hypothetical protein